MNYNIKFSFIVPVYNVEKYLSRCLDSLLIQNYNNYEIICVNDGSPDHSADILDVYKNQYNNIIIINQENKGLGGARNTGMEYASGDYLWFVDSDDWIEPDSLNLLSNYIVKEGFKDMILFDAYRAKQQGGERTLMKASKIKTFIDGIDYARCLLDGNGLLFSWIKICKRELFEKSGFQFNKGFYEDISEIPFYANNIKSIGYLEKPIYNYFINECSIMRTYDRRIFDALDQIAYLRKNLNQNDYLKSDLSYYEVRVVYNTNKRLKYVKHNLKRDFLAQVKTLRLCILRNISFVWNSRISKRRRLKMFFYDIILNLKLYLV